MDTANTYLIAHDLSDSSKIRSRDVLLAEDVTFEDLMLARNTYLGLKKCGFERPSPIQLETIPLGRCGFDLVVQSKAGTGKTCIFTIVALDALQFNPNNCTQTLILTPTREIATQIHEVISLIGSEYKNLNCALCIGGIEVKQDRAKLGCSNAYGGLCQIVVGTPGRVRQLIELNILKIGQIELFVLDEADKLMDEQFKIQIDEIYKRLPSDKQMIVTSATYFDELSLFLQQYMKSAKSIRVGKELSLEGVEEFYVQSKAGHSSKTNLENKFRALRMLLDQLEFTKCFVFTNFQSRAPLICDSLNKDKLFCDKYGPTKYICAELTQDERNRVFKEFKNSEQKLLVSTDISARGIDIQGIELVINFDLPMDKATYFHRIGRAGRFGQSGKAVSIVSGESVDQSVFKKSVKSERINKLSLKEL